MKPAFNIMSSSDETQFVAQLTAHQLMLTLYVRSLLPGDPAAIDVLQQANAKIWEKRHSFEMGSNFRAWAFAIARFEVLDYRKDRARHARLTFSEDLESIIANELSSQHDDIAVRSDALSKCLQLMNTANRELLLHRYSSDQSINDYAQSSGRSAAGLRVTLHRLRNQLLECVQRKLNGQSTDWKGAVQ
jgi:RNA polymerase sigma-70 factor, ECF subfamily